MTTVPDKRCPRCETTKPASDFYVARAKAEKDGLGRWCIECNLTYTRNKRDGLRDQIHDLLGNKCVDCGFSDRRAIQIDHVNSDGASERRVRVAPITYLKHILASVQAGDGRYALRCCNCNWIKRITHEESGGSLRGQPKKKRNNMR